MDWNKYYESRPRRSDVKISCPRKYEIEEVDVWGPDDCCSHCGSLDPDILMQRILQKDVSLVPTDKNYKIYVKNKGGTPFKMTYRPSSDGGDDPTKWVWTTEERNETKFYFQHLSKEQRNVFIEHLNNKQIMFEYPGYFYNIPYFISYEKE